MTGGRIAVPGVPVMAGSRPIVRVALADHGVVVGGVAVEIQRNVGGAEECAA